MFDQTNEETTMTTKQRNCWVYVQPTGERWRIVHKITSYADTTIDQYHEAVIAMHGLPPTTFDVIDDHTILHDAGGAEWGISTRPYYSHKSIDEHLRGKQHS
jgi:hypothetical protein